MQRHVRETLDMHEVSVWEAKPANTPEVTNTPVYFNKVLKKPSGGAELYTLVLFLFTRVLVSMDSVQVSLKN